MSEKEASFRSPGGEHDGAPPGEAVWRLARLDPGGFRLESGTIWIEARRARDGWILHQESGGPVAERIARDRAGFRLLREHDDGFTEVARTSRMEPGVPRSGPVSLLASDGCLCRIGPVGPGGTAWVVRPWEVGGPYFEALPEGEGWTIRPTVAGAVVPKGFELLVLLAAELLELDG